MENALSHITVLDLSRDLAGPWAGQVLADLGAEVIKIERAVGNDAQFSRLCAEMGIGELARDAGFATNKNRAHGRDERVGVQAFDDSVEFTYRLIKAMGKEK